MSRAQSPGDVSQGLVLSASATQLATWIRDRRMTSRQVVQIHIDHVRRVNPRLNAMVVERFADALLEADRADEAVREGDDVGPLHGVPCTIKECFAVTGMPQTSGAISRLGIVAHDDATTVARLRGAGAIVLGVTNVSELCMWMESKNRVYGRTNNPYDHRRTVGGSSGGEGAIVGSGASPFGLGADVGGSIRMPAFFNGVFGHKPSGGLVPGSGQFPFAEGKARRYLSTGPLCRRADDLWPLLQVLRGPDGIDDGAEDMDIGHPNNIDVRDLRIIDIPDDGGRLPVHRDLRAAQARVSSYLRTTGARVEQRRLPRLKKGLEIWTALMHEAAETPFNEILADGGARVRLRDELPRWARRRSSYTLPSLGLAGLERLTARFESLNERSVVLGRELREELDELLGDDGVMLYPSHSVTAPYHGAALLPPVYWAYTAVLNVMETAVSQVPLGLNRRGVPLGVQVVARRGGDALTIAVARELERGFGGWVPPVSIRRARSA